MTEILILIDRLPPELKRYIYYYLPVTIRLRLRKDDYMTFYYKYVYSRLSDEITYARKLISYNMSFIFELFIKSIGKKLDQNKKLYYSNIKYDSLYELYSNLCIKYESTNCRNILRYSSRLKQ